MSFMPTSSIVLTASVILALCVACQPRATPPTDTAPPPTPTPTAVASPTPTNCPTAWSWATGPGSPDFDRALTQSLTEAGLTVRTAISSAFGENNLCNGLFHAMALDVIVELDAADASDESAFADISARVAKHAQDALSISGVPNLGRLTVRFVAPEATWECISAGGGTDCRVAP